MFELINLLYLEYNKWSSFLFFSIFIKFETQVNQDESEGGERLSVPLLCVQITAPNELPHQNHDPVINILALSPSYPHTRAEF